MNGEVVLAQQTPSVVQEIGEEASQVSAATEAVGLDTKGLSNRNQQVIVGAARVFASVPP